MCAPHNTLVQVTSNYVRRSSEKHSWASRAEDLWAVSHLVLYITFRPYTTVSDGWKHRQYIPVFMLKRWSFVLQFSLAPLCIIHRQPRRALSVFSLKFNSTCKHKCFSASMRGCFSAPSWLVLHLKFVLTGTLTNGTITDLIISPPSSAGAITKGCTDKRRKLD